MPQTMLGAAAAAASAMVAIDSCPGALAVTLPEPPRAGLAVTAEARAAELRPTATGTNARQALPGIARLRYDGGGDWYANPSSLPNLLREIRERTSIPLEERADEVSMTDPDLADHPYLYATGHGNMLLSPAEVARLREYLLEGGFLHVDDNYGLDESFRREIARAFPDTPLADVPADHPVYHIFYEMSDGLPKVHEHDGEPAQGLGLFLDGRLALFYSYQSDLGDGWEDAAVHGDPDDIREQAIRMGVNLFLYAISATAAG